MLMSDVNEFCYLGYKKMLNDYLKKKCNNSTVFDNNNEYLSRLWAWFFILLWLRMRPHPPVRSHSTGHTLSPLPRTLACHYFPTALLGIPERATTWHITGSKFSTGILLTLRRIENKRFISEMRKRESGSG